MKNPTSALLNDEKPSMITNSVIIGTSSRDIANDIIGDRRHTFRLSVTTLLILSKIIDNILVTYGKTLVSITDNYSFDFLYLLYIDK